MKNEERKMESIGKDKFKLTVKRNNGDIQVQNIFTKAQMKENLEYFKGNKNVLMTRKAQAVKQLQNLNVEDTPELRKFAEQLKKVQDLEKKQVLENEINQINKDLEEHETYLKEIKNVLPELFR